MDKEKLDELDDIIKESESDEVIIVKTVDNSVSVSNSTNNVFIGHAHGEPCNIKATVLSIFEKAAKIERLFINDKEAIYKKVK